MSKGRRCAFIVTRPCPVDIDEIPLDVCRLCIDAWKTSAEIQSLTGVPVVPEAVTVQGAAHALQRVSPTLQKGAPSEPPLIELNVPDAAPRDVETHRRLRELDAAFIDNGIDAEDYIKRRRMLVSQLSKAKRVNLPQEARDLIDDEEYSDESPGEDGASKKLRPLLLIEQSKVGFKVVRIPGDFELPPSLTDANLRSILALYRKLDRAEKRMLVKFNGTKLGIIGKGNKLLCVILEEDEDLDDYEEDLEHLTELLSEIDGVDPQKALSEAVGKVISFSRRLQKNKPNGGQDA
jgi:hypothetical protein